VLMATGVACLCINDAIAKTLTASYPPLQIFFLRNLIAFPFALLLALASGGHGALRSHRPVAHLARGVLWIAATVLFFSSLRYLGLAEATALVFVAPVFITALSAVLLRETVGRRGWLAVISGLIGVLVVVRPGGAAFQPASLLPVATALVYALLMIGARWVDARESVWTLLLYMTGTGAVLGGLAVPLVWVTPHLEDTWLFLGIALFGTAGMTMMTQAFRFAPAVVIAPLDYTALLWATGLGWLIWGEIPDALTCLGAGIIILSGIYAILRERNESGWRDAARRSRKKPSTGKIAP
jgi:drug/metabolite transporter (DMT)-like permease